jgi:hypothetical protein
MSELCLLRDAVWQEAAGGSLQKNPGGLPLQPLVLTTGVPARCWPSPTAADQRKLEELIAVAVEKQNT